MFLPDCTSGLFSLQFHLLNHLIENYSNFQGIFRLDVSLCEQCNTSIKAASHHTSKRREMRMDEMMFRLDQMQTNAS